MPLIQLVVPSPQDRMPAPFADREAQARLKLHLMMARLRAALRGLMDADRDWTGVNWNRNLEDEAEQILVHIGYCALNGFRIRIPYLVQDIADVIFANEHPVGADGFTLPASINLEFMAMDDSVILGTTKEHCYWWNNNNHAESCRITRLVISEHFIDFYNKVEEEYGNDHMSLEKQRIIRYIGPHEDSVPGLAERPPAPTPDADGEPSDRDGPCSKCQPAFRAITEAYSELQVIQRRVDEAIRVGEEAADRSAAKIGIYDALDQINREHGEPFRDGDSLPNEYEARFPRHKHGDPMTKGKKKQVNTSREVEGIADYLSGTANDQPDPDPMSSPSPPTSVPNDFQPGSESSDDPDYEYEEGDWDQPIDVSSGAEQGSSGDSEPSEEEHDHAEADDDGVEDYSGGSEVAEEDDDGAEEDDDSAEDQL